MKDVKGKGERVWREGKGNVERWEWGVKRKGVKGGLGKEGKRKGDSEL